MTLKDGVVCPSNPFQHGAELILNFMGCKEDYMMLQADGGHDHDCAIPRNIVSILMIMIKLKMQHSIAMKNAGGYSSCNPIERPMGSIAFGSQCLALYRLEGPK